MNYETYQTIDHGIHLCLLPNGRSITCPVHDLGMRPPQPPAERQAETARGVAELIALIGEAPVEAAAPKVTGPFTFDGTRTFVVPAAFWNDHVDRACRCGEGCPGRVDDHGGDYGVETSRGVRVDLNSIDANELLSDARHYSDVTRWASPEYIGIQSSARATVKRLEKELT